MTTVARQLVTADEFDEIAASLEGKAELIAGEVIEMSGPTPGHALVAAKFTTGLAIFVDAHGLGAVLHPTAFRVRRDPDWVPIPDVAFVATGRLRLLNARASRYEVAPDLAVEVSSPSNLDDRSMEKVQAYIEAGASRVWMVYPSLRVVTVWRRGESGRLTAIAFEDSDTLTSDEAGFTVAGFALPLGPIFDAYDTVAAASPEGPAEAL